MLTFIDFCKTTNFPHSTENGVDGLQFTKAWIARNAAMLAEKQKLAGGNPGQASSSLTDAASSSAASVGAAALLERHQANAILNASYLELLEWDEEHQVYPEVRPGFTNQFLPNYLFLLFFKLLVNVNVN